MKFYWMTGKVNLYNFDQIEVQTVFYAIFQPLGIRGGVHLIGAVWREYAAAEFGTIRPTYCDDFRRGPKNTAEFVPNL